MGSSGNNQNRILAKLSVTSRMAGNSTIQWLIGLIIAVLTLIATFAPGEFRTFIGLGEPQVKQIPVPEESSLSVDELDESKVSYTPSAYTVNEHQPKFVKNVQTRFLVVFQNIDGEEFVSLTISPKGENSSIHAVLSGYTEEFKSSAGVFNVQILNIDYGNKNVMIQINRKP
ncbi:MAG: hypothetical protein KAI83_09010 [Thiomargarita sp.]|nr:hypothetical protein [Thiomargarita sp.]